MRDSKETLAWYDAHTTTAKLGFNPNGMCMKICRSARGLGAVYPSALASQLATPSNKRVTRLNDIKPGMVMYFDDVRDSNPYGHIVTVQSRATTVKSLSDIVVWTNSVKSGQVVKVKADYFQRYWGDEFQFASAWMNGQDLPLEEKAPPRLPVDGPGLLSKGRGPRLRHAIKDLEIMIEFHEERGRTRFAKALRRDLAELKETLKKFD